MPPDHELDELLGAYALDALDDDERGRVDEYLSRCAAARREVAEHLEVAALLGNAAGEPPAAIWERVEARLVTSRATAIVPFAPRPGAGVRFRRWAGAALGSAAAIVIAVLAATVIHQEGRIDDLARSAPAERPGAVEVERLLTRPTTRLATLVSSDRTVVVRVVLGADGSGWVLGEQLPALPSGRTYQLWGVSGGRVLSLGVLGPRPSTLPIAAAGVPSAAGGGWSAFAITAEAGPGVVASAASAVVAGTLA